MKPNIDILSTRPASAGLIVDPNGFVGQSGDIFAVTNLHIASGYRGSVQCHSNFVTRAQKIIDISRFCPMKVVAVAAE